MVSRLSRGRAGARLALVPVTVLAAVLALAVPAASASPAPAAHRIRVVMLGTLVAGLHVRSQPSVRARMTSRLGRRGTRVTITCWADGSLVAGNPVWYHISGPRRGYVTSYYINTHTDPYPGLARCKTPFRHGYHSLVTGVRVRTGPGARFRVVHKLGRAGSPVVVRCWTSGEAIWGDRAWYRLTSPRRGYTAGFHLDTGRDPARGVPRC
jgi:hypothetical protein